MQQQLLLMNTAKWFLILQNTTKPEKSVKTPLKKQKKTKYM